jgi:hypothetical protein
MPLRTTRDKAMHQLHRGRLRMTARKFNQEVRDFVGLCACIGTDCRTRGCWVMRHPRRDLS